MTEALTRTRYQAQVKPPDNHMLKPGRSNKKLGHRVTVGAHAGAQIFQLTLEERRSCPTDCLMWQVCYGNNMPFAKRHDHTAPDFEVKLAASVENICRGKPVLLRLHVLGDFFSPEYVQFWGRQLRQHAELSLFGYTAHKHGSEIGQELHGLALEFGWSRAAIRFSGYGGPYRGAVVADAPPSGTFQCPEQVGRVKSCAECGACWDGEKSVCFIEH